MYYVLCRNNIIYIYTYTYYKFIILLHDKNLKITLKMCHNGNSQSKLIIIYAICNFIVKRRRNYIAKQREKQKYTFTVFSLQYSTKVKHPDSCSILFQKLNINLPAQQPIRNISKNAINKFPCR